ncbi:MAG: methylated-DNA--[protein]-cysteine S-methyltransferase [Phycisphaerales bacterium]|nr:methylated-DNA--[protein]-cysteine S-methyltransferase [Phycisphaerales bacterium]
MTPPMTSSTSISTPYGALVIRLPTPEIVSAVKRALADGGRIKRTPMPAGTPFQQACWRAAKTTPRGQTRSYLWLAERALRALGRDPAQARVCARAAGQAMRRNPWPVAIPCHRIVASDGSLGGFAGARSPNCKLLKMKAWLLKMEQD